MSHRPAMLVLRGARIVGGDGSPLDLRLIDGRIAAMAQRIDAAGAESIELDGRWLIPGLWDRHVHFTQWAKTRTRLDLSEARSAADAVRIINERSGAAFGWGDWERDAVIVAQGFRDALWPDSPTAALLDAAVPKRPAVLISADLHTVWLNTAAHRRYGTATAGILREQDAFDVQVRLDREATAGEDALLADAIAGAQARGVVGIGDLEMADGPAVWSGRAAAGPLGLRVHAGFYPQHLDVAIARGLTAGAQVPGTGGMVTVGPLKLFADGSLNTRTALCHEPYAGAAGHGHSAQTDAGLHALMGRAHAAGLEVALHAIGDLAVAHALDAFAATGARGSIEHAQLVDATDLPRFAALGVRATVQPQHAIDDRDVAAALWGDRTDRAYAYRSLVGAGAAIALSSDAPVAPLDPWVTIAAAVHRSGDGREPWHPEQHLTVVQALAASTGGGTVRPGERADLVALDSDPLAATPAQLRDMQVALTVVAGAVTHGDLG